MNSKIIDNPISPNLDRRKELKRPDISTVELARLYFQDGLPIKEISAQLGVAGTTISFRLRRAGYTMRHWTGGPKTLPLAMDDVARLYFEDRMSALEISKKLKCCDE